MQSLNLMFSIYSLMYHKQETFENDNKVNSERGSHVCKGYLSDNSLSSLQLRCLPGQNKHVFFTALYEDYTWLQYSLLSKTWSQSVPTVFDFCVLPCLHCFFLVSENNRGCAYSIHPEERTFARVPCGLFFNRGFLAQNHIKYKC